MYTMLQVFLLEFLISCFEASTSTCVDIVFNKEYLNPKSVDHRQISGRWYEHMDTLNNTIRDNTFVDMVTLFDEKMSAVQIYYTWIPSLEECRTMVLAIQPTTLHSPEGTVIRMSTNETLGESTILYFDAHPTKGFVVGHQHTQFADNYFVYCRQKDAENFREAIKQALTALNLNIGDFYLKSKDFGCEQKEERGIKL